MPYASDHSPSYNNSTNALLELLFYLQLISVACNIKCNVYKQIYSCR